MTRFEIISEIGCLICGKPPQIHHLKGHEFGTGKGKRAADYLTIGLCREHHTGNDGYHHSPYDFSQKYGIQADLLDQQDSAIDDYCNSWGIEYPTKCR